MELIPHEELKGSHAFNFAPMIDFLFLMLALFATLAISRAKLFDTQIELAKLKPERQVEAKSDLHSVNLSVDAEGRYKWLTQFQEYPMEGPRAVQDELNRQVELGALPKERAHTEVLLHIDRKAPWESIAKLVFGVREAGFVAKPLYEGD